MPRIRSLGAFLFIIAWLAYDHYEPWVNFHSEALALCGMVLLAIAECLRTQNSPSWGTPRAPVIFLASVIGYVWLLLFLGIGLFLGEAVLVSLYLYGLFVSIALGHRYATIGVPDANLKWLFIPLAVAALLSAAIGLLQWLDLEGVLGMYVVEASLGDRPMGNMGQPNQLATLLLMGLISLAWLFARGHGGGLVSVAAAGFLTLILALTQSRAGMLGAIAAGFFLAWKAHLAPSRMVPKHFLVWLLVYGLLLLLVPTIYDLLLMSGGRSTASLFTTSDRYAIWGQALAAVAQSPWLGYGWLQTPAAQAVGSMTVPGTMIFTFSHNIVLDSMVEYPFAYSYFLLAAGLLVGVVEAAHVRSVVTHLSPKLVALGLGVWFCLGAFMVVEYFQREAEYRLARLVNQGLEPAPPDFQPTSVHLLTQLGGLLNAVRVQPARNMPPAELETMRRVLHRFANREIHLNYIVALGLNGNTSEAIRQLSILRAMYGNRSFKVAQFVLRNWQKTHPELDLVKVPS